MITQKFKKLCFVIVLFGFIFPNYFSFSNLTASDKPTSEPSLFILGLVQYGWQETGAASIENVLVKNLVKQPYEIKVYYLKPIKELQDIVKKNKDKKIMIIACGSEGPKAADLTQDNKIDTIILFDPDAATGKFPPYEPIKFNYDNIANRVYNFYGEARASGTGYRKITPGIDLKTKEPYLKAVNIKCITNKDDCLYHNFDFLAHAYRDAYKFLGQKATYPYIVDWGHRAIILFNQMPEIIKKTENFKFNTDLACYLWYVDGGNPCKSPVIPIPQDKTPFLVINRFVTITKLDNKNLLTYLVAKATSINKLAEDYVWKYELTDNQAQQIQKQLVIEGKLNAKQSADVPYSTLAKSMLKVGYLAELENSLGISWVVGKFKTSGFKQWIDLEQQPLIRNNPRKTKIAEVRQSNDLCEQEKKYLEKRERKVKDALTKFLNNGPLPKVPKIAIVGSGGGIRAMLTMLGALKGLQEIGLLDSTMYIAALSGSTWATALLESSAKNKKNIKEALDGVIDGIALSLASDIKSGTIAQQLLEPELQYTQHIKDAFMQPRTLVDWWGRLIARTLFPKVLSSNYYEQLTSQSSVVETGEFPLPIYTAINISPDVKDEKITELEDKCETEEDWILIEPRRNEPQELPKWYEFTPYEIGGEWLEAYVPTWAFGRKFAYGTSQDQAPEQTLGCFLGIFGSAIAAHYGKMVETGKIADIIKWVGLEDKRLTRGRFYNFTYGMQKGPLVNEEFMDMVDAGIAFNLPYPPISGKRKFGVDERPVRKADIIIFVDGSADKEPGSELRKVAKWAKINELPFPKIPSHQEKNIRYYSISIFKDDTNPDAPLVIYLPFARNEKIDEQTIKNFKIEDSIKENIRKFKYETFMAGTCSTFNFTYTPEQALTVIRLMQFNVQSNEELIRREMIKWLKKEKEVVLPKLSKDKETRVNDIVKILTTEKNKEEALQNLLKELQDLGISKEYLIEQGIGEEYLKNYKEKK